ncbi:multiple epidermal growth factor-like domains protein 10 isoform X2 [Biomphalaria glabrata]|uniref:Multiple epidermal growth factor-like domains protein 10 isoform X2 n=1 Tax=Biomphalaria glabrata TaxID=6526 RepID=A0A9W2Z3U7_BIOGL|nr:multiple epidermal growth factor-like domains protein 10 isoform X2 [Biomphalaria glabrata]
MRLHAYVITLNMCGIYILFRLVQSQTCERGFMGSGCNFKCNSDCVSLDNCNPGYFGPLCQYLDLVLGNSAVYTDRSSKTCKTFNNMSEVTIPMTVRFFSFIKLVFLYPVEDLNIRVEFQRNGSDNTFSSCPGVGKETRNYYDNTSVDIYCMTIGEVANVKLKFGDTVYLCEVYISGGRNLALRSSTSGSTLRSGFRDSSFAVDGRRPTTTGLISDECFATVFFFDSNQRFTLVFATAVRLFYFLIFIKPSDNKQMSRFELQTFDSNDVLVMRYQEPLTIVPNLTLVPHTNTSIAIKRLAVTVAQDCIDQKYGLACESSCSKACNNSLCNLAGRCLECPPGKYGPIACDFSCSPNCIDNTTCYRNGTCVGGCKQTHYDPKCLTKCDRKGCDTKEGCLIDGTCNSCLPRFTGPTCEGKCPINCGGNFSCDKLQGNCIDGCMDGFYDFSCTTTCDFRCGGTQKCEIVSGLCLDGCQSKYYGPRCLQYCPVNCGANVTCNKVTGNCDKGCKDGYYGERCQYNCPLRCRQRCDQDAKCGKGCSPGYTGTDCVKRCPSVCGGLSACHQITEECEQCKSGFYSRNCSLKCINCGKDESCDRVTGRCNFGCAAQFYGENCVKECDRACEVCRNDSGECTICQPGYYGNCKQNCRNICNNTLRCDKIYGYCRLTCGSRKYGKECKDACPLMCGADGNCHKETGECLEGCLPGYYLADCTGRCDKNCANVSCEVHTGKCIACPDGWAGVECEKRCQNCIDNVCDQDSLQCIRGCIGGDCVEEEKGSNALLIMVTVLFVMILLYVIVTLVRVKHQHLNTE